jgi:hypothetical protein
LINILSCSVQSTLSLTFFSGCCPCFILLYNLILLIILEAFAKLDKNVNFP